MNNTKNDGWQHTSPLAVIFYIGRIVEFAIKNAVQALAPLFAFLVAYQGNLKDKLLFAIAGLVVIVFGLSILRYLFFRFRVTADSVLIREGVIKKTQLDIKFDRIQAINTEQNIIYRYFGLITIKFDTAGSAGQEGSLPAVKPELADRLRKKIRNNTPNATEDNKQSVQPPTNSLLELNSRDMIRIGLSDNRAFIFLALLSPLFEQAGNYIESVVDGNTVLTVLAMNMGWDPNASLAVIIGAGVITFLVLASIIGAILRFNNFHLTETAGVFQSVGGLLTRHVHTTNRNKIQTIVTSQNIILRAFRRYRINARQASPGKKKYHQKRLRDSNLLYGKTQRADAEFLWA